MRQTRVVTVLLSLVLAFSACNERDKAAPGPNGAQEPSSEASLLGSRLQSSTQPEFVKGDGASRYVWAEARRFYAQNHFQLAWSDRGRRRSDVDALVRALKVADLEGLDSRDYQVDAVAAIPRSGMDETRAVEADLLATYAFLAYAWDVTHGRTDPEDIDPHWRAADRRVDLHAALDGAIRNGNVAEALEGLAPKSAQYGGLKSQLAQYREMAIAGGWPRVPAAPALRRGSRHPAVAVLRTRLSKSGDLANTAAADPQLFDEKVEAGVRHFQLRHGLEPDGAYATATALVVNVPLDERIRQIALNMERWRWLADDLGPRYLLVNIPAFHLDAIENGRSVLGMKVVTGKTENKTPVLADEITTVVFSPYWNIPPDILQKETIPQAAKDPGYLERNNIEVLGPGDDGPVDPSSVNWSDVDTRRVRLRQRPGKGNSLGGVKFVFPNHYNVYLHDTPAEALFDRIERDFSHGCIRLERPADLAQYVLRDQSEWTPERITQAMDAGVERGVALKQPLPIYLVYFTAWEEGGNVHFRDDVYGYDHRAAE
jgi:murein L,D-transpeptidase YcbB/YkuD